MKYKITIGDKVFDAESNGYGSFKIKNGRRDVYLSKYELDIFDSKIEEIKEPLRVEFNVMVPNPEKDTPKLEVVGGSERSGYYLHKFAGKPVKITIEEIPPTQCEHIFIAYWHDNTLKCTKCGELK